MQAPASEREVTAARKLTPRSLPRPSVLRFAGALDARTVRDELRRMDAVAATNPHQVVIDFAELELLDSAGVHALVNLYKQVTAQGGKFVVVHAHDQPLMVLGVLKLQSVFGL